MDNKLAKIIFNDLLYIQGQKSWDKKRIEYLSKSLINGNLCKTNCKTELELLKNLGLPPKIKDINISILQANLNELEDKSDTDVFVSLRDNHFSKLNMEEVIHLPKTGLSFKALNNKYMYGNHNWIVLGTKHDMVTGAFIYSILATTTKNNYLERTIGGVSIGKPINNKNIDPSMFDQILFHTKDGIKLVRGPQTWGYGEYGNTPVQYTENPEQFFWGTVIEVKEGDLHKLVILPQSKKVLSLENVNCIKDAFIRYCKSKPGYYLIEYFDPLTGTFKKVSVEEIIASAENYRVNEVSHNINIHNQFNSEKLNFNKDNISNIVNNNIDNSKE